jgi:hypothetical protein
MTAAYLKDNGINFDRLYSPVTPPPSKKTSFHLGKSKVLLHETFPIKYSIFASLKAKSNFRTGFGVSQVRRAHIMLNFFTPLLNPSQRCYLIAGQLHINSAILKLILTP